MTHLRADLPPMRPRTLTSAFRFGFGRLDTGFRLCPCNAIRSSSVHHTYPLFTISLLDIRPSGVQILPALEGRMPSLFSHPSKRMCLVISQLGHHHSSFLSGGSDRQ